MIGVPGLPYIRTRSIHDHGTRCNFGHQQVGTHTVNLKIWKFENYIIFLIKDISEGISSDKVAENSTIEKSAVSFGNNIVPYDCPQRPLCLRCSLKTRLFFQHFCCTLLLHSFHSHISIRFTFIKT